MTAVLLAFVLLAAIAAFFLARQRAFSVVGGELRELHSRPAFHGLYSSLWVLMAGTGAVILLTIVLLLTMVQFGLLRQKGGR